MGLVASAIINSAQAKVASVSFEHVRASSELIAEVLIEGAEQTGAYAIESVTDSITVKSPEFVATARITQEFFGAQASETLRILYAPELEGGGPLLVQGDHLIVFLAAAKERPGYFYVVGDWAGAIAIKEDMLGPLRFRDFTGFIRLDYFTRLLRSVSSDGEFKGSDFLKSPNIRPGKGAIPPK